MKNSPQPARPSVTAPVKAVNSSSAPHAVALPSVPSSGILRTLQNLRPRFLEGLSPSEIELVVAAAKQVGAVGNSVITHQDRPAEHLYLLLTGRARYFSLTETGRKVILLWIPPGQIFGGTALLTASSTYLVSAEAAKNSSMLVWDRAKIRSLATRYPRLVENAYSEAYNYLVAYRAAHLSMICDTGPERLAYVLTSLASGMGEKVADGVELKIRNEELANEANVTLFTASRLLSQWQRRGMVVKSRGKILLRSPELLLRHST